jgi:L-ascorbate metabolism protein UlaG (beta-lactamase superfamily)
MAMPLRVGEFARYDNAAARKDAARMKLTWFGHSAFRVEIKDAVILIDPFLTGNPAFAGDAKAAAAGATHVCVTHAHGDHVGDTVQIAAETGATVITNYDLCMHLAAKGVKSFSPMNTGGTVDFGAFRASLVRADHSAGMGEGGVAQPVGNANGVIIRAANEPTLWHMGDTDIFSDMALISELYGVEVCICPIGDRFTMGAKHAALAMTRYVKPKVAIPCHYGSFGIIDQTADAFVDALAASGAHGMAVKPLVLEKGVAAVV